MIIDDDTAIGNLEQEVLERVGYKVLRAYSGTEALLLLKNASPNLILLDLMLPGLSGEELLPQLQGIPVRQSYMLREYLLSAFPCHTPRTNR